MPDRFYAPGDWSDIVELEGPEAHHLVRVMRATPGDQIELFNGRGSSARALVESVSKRSVTARILPPLKQTTPPSCEIVIAAAMPKGERLRWMIEKVTELGVDRLIPLTTKRSVVEPSDHKLHKAEQVALAACKQCGRDRTLVLEELCPLEELPQRLPLESTRFCYGSLPASNVPSITPQTLYDQRAVAAVIGPEGGITADEELLLRSWDAAPVTLAPYVLRIETAAIAFGVWLCHGRQTSSSRIF